MIRDSGLIDLARRAGKGDPNALAELKASAELGNTDAMFHLGRLHDVSAGGAVHSRTPFAKEWYEKAALAGHALSQFALGNMYDLGEGVKQNYEIARKWYEAAAGQGVAYAQMHFGRMLELGRGGNRSLEEAAHWYAKAADHGDELASTNLGLLHYRAEIKNANDNEAFRRFSFSAERLDGLAHLMLGQMYFDGRSGRQHGGLALFHFCVATLLLPESENGTVATERKEMILSQYPEQRVSFETRALGYVSARKSALRR